MSAKQTHSHSSSSPPPSPPEGPSGSKDDLQEKIKTIQNYEYLQELRSGYLRVRLIRLPEEVDFTVDLLAAAAAEVTPPPATLASLRNSVKKDLIISENKFPNCAILTGIYKAKGHETEELAGTIKVFFSNSAPHHHGLLLPPPPASPYTCNMAVKQTLQGKGIAWHLLKAVDELTRLMSPSQVLYAHAATNGPLGMYLRAGYNIITTEGDFHLISKKLQSKM